LFSPRRDRNGLDRAQFRDHPATLRTCTAETTSEDSPTSTRSPHEPRSPVRHPQANAACSPTVS
jgi:hypothetical protein